MIKIENMKSNRGNDIPNQFVIQTDNYRIFQSYKSVIALIDKTTSKIKLDSNYWDYSRTTGKFRNSFLNESKKETLKKIKSGEYNLEDLSDVKL